MNESIFILKGNIIYSKSLTEFEICEHGYLVCREGHVEGVYQTLPFRLGGNPVYDYGDCLIVPGLVDLHIHAPQYSFRGLGMDMDKSMHFRDRTQRGNAASHGYDGKDRA